MSVIARPELNNQRKPVFGSGYRFNRLHPLFRNLKCLWLLNERAGAPLDLLSRTMGVFSGGAAWTPIGITVPSNGNVNIGKASCTAPMTYIAVVNTAITGGIQTIRSGNHGRAQFRINETGYLQLVSERVALVGASTLPITANKNTVVAVTYNNANYAFYIDGVPSGSGAYSCNILWDGNIVDAFLGKNISAGGELFSGGSIMIFASYDRILSPAEILQWNNIFGTLDAPLFKYPTVHPLIPGSGVPSIYGTLSKTLDALTCAAAGTTAWAPLPFTDDFETDLSKWNVLYNSGGTITADDKYSGSKSLYTGGSWDWHQNVTKYIADVNALEFKIHTNWTNNSVGYDDVKPFLSFNTVDGIQISLCVISGKVFQIRLGGAGGTLLASGGYASAGWHKISGHVVIDGSNGSVVLKYDDSIILSYAGNTQLQDKAIINRVVLGSQGNWLFGYYDDFELTAHVLPGNPYYAYAQQ